jgi:hypothetical protein
MNDSSLSKEEKDKLISILKSQSLPDNYISPAWLATNYSVLTVEQANLIISKPWLIGFTEAEGSFYIVKKGVTRLTHAFEITQKLDRIVLKAISLIFGPLGLWPSFFKSPLIWQKQPLYEDRGSSCSWRGGKG